MKKLLEEPAHLDLASRKLLLAGKEEKPNARVQENLFAALGLSPLSPHDIHDGHDVSPSKEAHPVQIEGASLSSGGTPSPHHADTSSFSPETIGPKSALGALGATGSIASLSVSKIGVITTMIGLSLSGAYYSNLKRTEAKNSTPATQEVHEVHPPQLNQETEEPLPGIAPEVPSEKEPLVMPDESNRVEPPKPSSFPLRSAPLSSLKTPEQPTPKRAENDNALTPPAPLPKPQTYSLHDEALLVEELRQLEKRRDNAKLLTAIEEAKKHELRAFSLELEAMRISALARSGRGDEAKLAAERFLLSHPEGALAEKVRQSLSIISP